MLTHGRVPGLFFLVFFRMLRFSAISILESTWPEYLITSRDGPRIFLRRGRLLRNDFYIVSCFFFFFSRNTTCCRKPRVISGGTGCSPLHLSPRSAPDGNMFCNVMQCRNTKSNVNTPRHDKETLFAQIFLPRSLSGSVAIKPKKDL